MPNTPLTQHQNTAPGPPTAIAAEIPMIFPVPIVAASAVESAAYGERDAFSFPFPFSPEMLSRSPSGSLFWINPSRNVKYKCVPPKSTSIGKFHRLPLTAFIISLICPIFPPFSTAAYRWLPPASVSRTDRSRLCICSHKRNQNRSSILSR